MDYGDKTHPARAVPPARFRDQATGIGQARSASAATGAIRNAKVSAAMPAKQRAAVPAAEGFATDPMPVLMGAHEC
jgi:hypothetical protein